MDFRINKTLIYSFLVVKNLSKEDFCRFAKIRLSIFDKILLGEFHLCTLKKMAKFMNVDYKYLVIKD